MSQAVPLDVMAVADLAAPWSIRVAVTLGLAEHIDAGMCDVESLAHTVGCDRERLWALLALLADRGIFTATGADRFEMNEAARQLLDPSLREFLDLSGIGGRFAGVWTTLPDFVRTGATHYSTVFGRPFWDDLAAHPGLSESFDRLMAAGHGNEAGVPPLMGGWASVEWVVDVGGGTGHVVIHVLRANPRLRATVVDLPATAARAKATFAAAGLADRADAVGQSFFDALPAGADVYLLARVLNDWPDAEATAILRRCAEAARPTGHVLVAGGVRGDNDAPRTEIDKIVTGGRDRPLSQFRTMAASAGLSVLTASERHIECAPLPG